MARQPLPARRQAMRCRQTSEFRAGGGALESAQSSELHAEHRGCARISSGLSRAVEVAGGIECETANRAVAIRRGGERAPRLEREDAAPAGAILKTDPLPLPPLIASP